MQDELATARLLLDDVARDALTPPRAAATAPRATRPRAERLDARAWRGLPLADWNRIVRAAFRVGGLSTAAILEGRALSRDVELVVERTDSGIEVVGRAGDDGERSARAWYAAAVAQEIAGFRRAPGVALSEDERNAETVLRTAGRPWGTWPNERAAAESTLQWNWRAVLNIAEAALLGGPIPAPVAVLRIHRGLSYQARAHLGVWS